MTTASTVSGWAKRTGILSAVLALVAALTLSACGGGSHTAASSASGSRPATAATIVISNFEFKPSNLVVAAGATITVKNLDSATHTVTATSPHDKAFDTGDIGAGTDATFKAPATPGTYPYICLIHQFMHGTLTVR